MRLLNEKHALDQMYSAAMLTLHIKKTEDTFDEGDVMVVGFDSIDDRKPNTAFGVNGPAVENMPDRAREVALEGLPETTTAVITCAFARGAVMPVYKAEEVGLIEHKENLDPRKPVIEKEKDVYAAIKKAGLPADAVSEDILAVNLEIEFSQENWTALFFYDPETYEITACPGGLVSTGFQNQSPLPDILALRYGSSH